MRSSLAALLAATSVSTIRPSPAAATTETSTAVTSGYHKGFFIRSAEGPFELRLNGRVQARHSFEAIEGGENETAFSIPRARLSLSGTAFSESLSYKFEADFSKGFVNLKDFFVDYVLVPKALHLRAGQWKRPFSRQQISSSSRLEMADLAITDRFFGGGRDIGVAVHNGYESSPDFEYAVGLFNGSGEKASFSGDVEVDPATGEGEVTSGAFSNIPDHFHPALVLRLGANFGGVKGYSEADLEGGPLRAAIGGSGFFDFDADKDDRSHVRGELDFTLKLEGLSTTGGIYVSSAQSGAGFSNQSFEAVGFHVQAGYVIWQKFQPVLRYALIAPDGPENERQEFLGGLSVYFFGHNVKWQTEGGALRTDAAGGSSTDYVARTQLQLGF